MAVTISGMFGKDNTYFADSPVIVNITGLEWPANTPFTIVRLEVLNSNDNVVGAFNADTAGASSFTFDISSALRVLWAEETFSTETGKANNALTQTSGQSASRNHKAYRLRVKTEYLDDTDHLFHITSYGPFPSNGYCFCVIGGMTEMERAFTSNPSVIALNNTNPRNGDASTKPRSFPELVGKHSITSFVDLTPDGTLSIFYPSSVAPSPDDNVNYSPHAPIVARDSVDYVDFIFVNRRGAVETCSARMLEDMEINIETEVYSRVNSLSFAPDYSLIAAASGGRKKWSMSSGYQTREWAEWWTREFLMARRWWMRYTPIGSTTDSFIPVVVEPSKKDVAIYSRTKQRMPSVEFDVRLALEG